MTKRVKLVDLIEVEALYPRNRVDDTHVADLVRALEAGATLPPLVADERLRLADGWHRKVAIGRHFGLDAEANVDIRSYPDDAAFFLDAVQLNSAHGRKLDRHDQTRIALRLQALGVGTQEIALALQVPEPTVTMLALRIVHVENEGAVPLKRGLEHMKNQTLSQTQARVMESVRSAEAGRLALELRRLLEADLVDVGDAVVLERLRDLQAALERYLAGVVAA